MRSLTCVSVVVCVVRKLRPCLSYSRRRDRINLGLWRSLYKGVEGAKTPAFEHGWHCMHGHVHFSGGTRTVPYGQKVKRCP